MEGVIRLTTRVVEVTTMTTAEHPLGELESDDPEFEERPAAESGEGGRVHSTVVLTIFAPKEPRPRRFRFRFDETVGAAAKTAAVKFGYGEGTPSFQKEDGAVLDRDLTLQAAGVHNNEKLELVDAGGGV